MKQKGFTLIELLVVIAILGIIAAMVALNVGSFFGRAANNETATNETVVTNETLFWQLAIEPITSLNLTELNFMRDYCMTYAIYTHENGLGVINEKYAALASLYQNQIIINELKEQP